MCHILTVQVVKCSQCLQCVHASILLANLAVLTAHLSDTFIDVLKIDAEDVVLNDLRVVILHNMLMMKLLVPLYLFLDRFYFLLI